jgi:hypothetical protein
MGNREKSFFAFLFLFFLFFSFSFSFSSASFFFFSNQCYFIISIRFSSSSSSSSSFLTRRRRIRRTNDLFVKSLHARLVFSLIFLTRFLANRTDDIWKKKMLARSFIHSFIFFNQSNSFLAEQQE